MISVIVCTNRHTYRSNIKENFMRQTWKEKELIIILNKDSLVKEEWVAYFKDFTNVRIEQLNEKLTLGECLNFGIQLGKYEYISKMDDDDYYAEDYLMHSIQTLKNSDAQVVGKTTIYMYFEEDQTLYTFNPYKFASEEEKKTENRYDPKVLMGGTLLFEKCVNRKVPFQACNIGEDAKFCEACKELGIPIYSGTKDHYVYIRKNNDSHTWKIKNQKLKRFCSPIVETDDFHSYLNKD